jgi:general secretion pathway protein A
MYTSFFGLQKEPFSIAPDPRFLFMSERHREALAHLLYGVKGAGGVVVLSGEIGAGKTTVCRCFLEQIPEHCNVAYIFNPKLSALELLESICDEFQVENRPSSRQGVTVKDYIDPLNAFLLTTHANGQNNLLVIDEAQSLDVDVLEQLRLLTNLETNERKLLQIILIGQPELRDMLNQPELEQLAQRVVARFHLEPLDVAETRRYIRHRLAISGLNGPDLFERDAIQRIHKLTRGVPRRINQLCDRSLLGAYGQGQAHVNVATVKAAAKEILGSGGKRRASSKKSAHTGETASAWPLLGWSSLGVLGLSLLASLLLAPQWWQGLAGTPAIHLRGKPSSAAVLASPSRVSASSASRFAAPSKLALAAAAPLQAASGLAAALASAPVPTQAKRMPFELLPDNTSQAPVSVPSTSQENQALQVLVGRWGLVGIKQPGAICRELAQQQQVHCFRGIGTLATLWQLDRPMVLKLTDLPPEPTAANAATRPPAASNAPNNAPSHAPGHARYAVLFALDAQHATLGDENHTQRVPLAQLAQIWQGEFTTLWRAPAGFNASAASLRASLLERLSHAPGHVPATPSPGRSNELDLSPRIQAFQKTQGLPADGIAGPVTLMQLNRATGIKEPRLSGGDAVSR